MSPKGKGEMTFLFPITSPFPDPLKDIDLIPQEDIALEQDLLLNSANPRAWQNYINHISTTNRPSESQSFFHNPDDHLSSVQLRLLGPVSSPSNRLALKRLTFVYERALSLFPTSYSLWRDYLLQRMKYVLGEPKGGLEAFWSRQIRAGKEKLDVGPTLMDGKGGEEEWEWSVIEGGIGALDGRIGYREWESLAATFERALMFLPRVSKSFVFGLVLALIYICPFERCRVCGRFILQYSCILNVHLLFHIPTLDAPLIEHYGHYRLRYTFEYGSAIFDGLRIEEEKHVFGSGGDTSG